MVSWHLLRGAALLFAVIAAGSARAQGQPQQPPLPPLPAKSEALRPGTWVQYYITRRHAGNTILVRLAALERESGGQWFEINFTSAERRTLSIKVLVQGTLEAPRRVARALVQPQGQQALELPEKLAARQLPSFRRDPSKDKAAVKVGKGRLHVPAGTFAAEHYKLTEKGRVVEMWTSSEVAGWPMIKMQSPDLTLELAAHGKGATSQIHGKPAKLDERWLGGKP